ncbi:hypothetical protein ALC56_15068, partial [Trachymyrmex septentrionalis]
FFGNLVGSRIDIDGTTCICVQKFTPYLFDFRLDVFLRSATFETLMTVLSNLSFRVSISFCKNSIDEVALNSADGDILPPATPSCKCLLGCITVL